MICPLVLFKTSAVFILLVLPHMVSNVGSLSCPYGYTLRKLQCIRAVYHGEQLPGQISVLLGMKTTRKLYTLPPVTTTTTALEFDNVQLSLDEALEAPVRPAKEKPILNKNVDPE